MFNRTIVNPPAVHIDVKQQPNDAVDAARLYGELRERAEAEVRHATIERLGAKNLVTVAKVRREQLFETDQVRVRVLFSINGTPFDFEAEENSGVTRDVIAAIVDSVALQFTNALLATFSSTRQLREHGE
jgi:hypothetical protein